MVFVVFNGPDSIETRPKARRRAVAFRKHGAAGLSMRAKGARGVCALREANWRISAQVLKFYEAPESVRFSDLPSKTRGSYGVDRVPSSPSIPNPRGANQAGVVPNPRPRGKPGQANPNKIAWICLVLFVRIGTYQWVTAIPNKNFLSSRPSPYRQARLARRAFVF
jgi:hypothetical protein